MTAILLEILRAVWETLREMSPYLLFGFAVAGILSILIRAETVERHLGGRGVLQVVKAAVFGVPLPLCSCGVIPVSASLRRHGAGRGATTSFLISTPQTGVDSIMVTLSLLGPVFAVFRPIIAFASGVLGGGLVTLFGGEEERIDRRWPVCKDGSCGPDGTGGGIREALRYGFFTLPRDINRALVVGVLLAGVIAAIVPDDFFAGALGGGILSMLVLMAAGIPVYVCATASVPIAAALIAKGVSPGAALVFLMTGPATNAATVATVWKIMGRRTALIYLGTVAGAALGAGLLLDALFAEIGAEPGAAMPWMIPGSAKTAGAVLLSAIVVYSFFGRSGRGEGETIMAGTRLVLRIEGMTCEHCARSVRRALLETPGTTAADVDLGRGEAMVSGDDLDAEAMTRAVEELGYRVAGVEPPKRE